jgi:HK97 family phage major capsid protein
MTTTTVIPETPDQLEEAFNDEARMQSIFAEGNFGRFTHAYMKAFVGKHADDVKAFQEKAQADLADFMRIQNEKNGARPPEGWKPGDALAPAKGRGERRTRAAARYKGNLAGARDSAEFFDRQGLFSPMAVGAAEEIDNSEYTSDLKHFVWATIKGEHVAKKDGNAELYDKLMGLKGSLARSLEIRNATTMSERIPSEGGFLVPENLRSEMLALSLEEEVIRPEATVIPMDSLRVPLPSIDDTSHASSVFGGVSAAWTAEGAALSATAPKFSRLVLQANKLTAFTQIPNELLQDSATPMDVWFNTFFPMAMSFFADLAFLVGDGVDQPEGLINCPGAVTVTPTSSTGPIQLADVIAMLVRLWPPSLKRARWVCSPDALGQLLQMGLVVVSGTSGSTLTAVAPPSMLGGMQAIEAPGGSAGDGFNFKLLGIPLRVSEKVPFPGTNGIAGSLVLYDPTGYLVGDRQAMQVATSAEYAFANDEVSYRITQRMDGRGWQRTPLTPANGSANTLSMIVKLGAIT